jgi:hypothetical protein
VPGDQPLQHLALAPRQSFDALGKLAPFGLATVVAPLRLNAARTDASSTSSSNGFSRKSTAPPSSPRPPAAHRRDR